MAMPFLAPAPVKLSDPELPELEAGVAAAACVVGDERLIIVVTKLSVSGGGICVGATEPV